MSLSGDLARDMYLKSFWRPGLGYLSAADYLERRAVWVDFLNFTAMTHSLPVPMPVEYWANPLTADSKTWGWKSRDELFESVKQALADWDDGMPAIDHFPATPGHDYAGDRERLRAVMAVRDVPPAYVTEPLYFARHEKDSGLGTVTTCCRATFLENCAKAGLTAAQIEEKERALPLWWNQPEARLSRLDDWQRLCEWLQKVKWKRFRDPDQLPDDALREIMFVPFKTVSGFSDYTTEMYHALGLLRYYSSDRQRRKEQKGYGCVPDWKARLADLRAIAIEQEPNQ